MEMKTYEHETFGKLRTFIKDGSFWFVGKDVATMLGYKNPSDALSKYVDYAEKGIVRIDRHNMTIIDEGGLFSLLLSSKAKNAKEIKKWITKEVIPDMTKALIYGERPETETTELVAVADAKTELYLLTVKYKIAKQMTKLWDRAGVAPKYQAIGLNRHYDTITIPDDVFDALPDEE